ncbi:prespore-specific regulator [Bacillus mesophilus]|uniref:RsfA family transcriptional regulator n=1 Tax=Bacillus mesophilus TaxID=1808955 RepID=A0A6M0Q9M1_9BACI|nr:RsfA family transcriptional regulator [Bacillus mesophilus]MBM7660706.1 prespore-specific regulator [Bacillus mesophilus]NEY71748.1 RsfA family transcriptional regulator [Bacillus mesophilus]
MKVRSDAWTHEDDLLLAETVLRYIREGGTQLQAFEEVGDKLNRTSAACGFRWNAEVRRQYDQAISIAKKQRKERKRALANSTPASKTVTGEVMNRPTIQTVPTLPVEETNHEIQTYQQETAAEMTPTIAPPLRERTTTNRSTNLNLSIDDVIGFLTNLKQEGTQGTQAKLENERLKSENADFKRKNEELQRKVQKLSEQHTTIQEDYQALVQIMDRARRMVMFEDTEERNSPVFRMDKNGNLEQVAK